MKNLFLITFTVCCAAAVFGAELPPESRGAHPVSENVRGHEDTEWSISYGHGLVYASKKPRVLLIGDSITAQYVGAVKDLLAKDMSVTSWASSYCLTSKGYLKLLDFYLDEAEYAVIHFNNGLHSLKTPTEAWSRSLRAALKLIREKQPKAKIIWTTSTPLKDPEKTAKARELNAAASRVVAEFTDVETDDLFAAMDPLDREQHWADTYHFRDEARKMQAEQVAAACRRVAGLDAMSKGGCEK